MQPGGVGWHVGAGQGDVCLDARARRHALRGPHRHPALVTAEWEMIFLKKKKRKEKRKRRKERKKERKKKFEAKIKLEIFLSGM